MDEVRERVGECSGSGEGTNEWMTDGWFVVLCISVWYLWLLYVAHTHIFALGMEQGVVV